MATQYGSPRRRPRRVVDSLITMLPVEPGLLIVDGNRLEALRDLVFAWIDRRPLGPLEEEIFLVQSNATAEWLKTSLASSAGVCAALRVMLPGRFLWQAYRQVLGPARVGVQSPLEREPLTWRLMRLLPALVARPTFAPVARYLAGRGAEQRLQLARRIADLFDQYQVYRADWLAAWERDSFTLPGPSGAGRPVPEDQRWQAALWRAILDELDEGLVAASRPQVHRAFVAALEAAHEPCGRLPRRVILFGTSHVAPQVLDALLALSTRCQVIVAVVNPCRHHWADIIDGRELLRRTRVRPSRHAAKDARDPANVPFEAMHLYAHPLLAAWGRQGRDFMEQLDELDDLAQRRRIELPKIDTFDDGPGTTLLSGVQATIRDLVPLSEHRRAAVAAGDRSIVFHVAHGVQREVEILHDQLLAMLAVGDATTNPPLRPRDVLVMVPDIEAFAPSIRAVFGQYPRTDPRFVPYDIADLASRGSDPLVAALEWLLRLPEQRIGLQEVRDLLEVPAVASRRGIAAAALPGLFDWLAGAGVRWGIDAGHRAGLGLGATGEQNSWSFGLRRMLLGYASGASRGFAGIEPYDEIGGLEAAVIGAIVDLLEQIDRWCSRLRQDATPVAWTETARELLDAFFAPADERERLTMVALQAALGEWLAACSCAAFDQPVPLAVMREAWLAGVDGLERSRRFMTGGVTFCTLLPLRAVPFEVVCLLGMNDGAFPRATQRNDFDLMGLPGQHRPGDRSRRDDDRYLMLEALLSARRTLYVGWSGFDPRDNSAQPPSVLIAQLRDYLDAGWCGTDGGPVLGDRTTEHPLQPFGRRYFEDGGPVTFAREWRAAHRPVDGRDRASAPTSGDGADGPSRTSLRELAGFLRNPARAFFRARLGIVVGDEDERVDDDEAFELGGLARYQLRQSLVDGVAATLVRDDGRTVELASIADAVRRAVARIDAAGSLPLFESGRRIADEACEMVVPMLERWTATRAVYPVERDGWVVRIGFRDRACDDRVMEARVIDDCLIDDCIIDDRIIDDRIDGLRANGSDDTVRLLLTPSRLLDKGDVRADRLIDAWVTMLAAAASGEPLTTLVIGCDATLSIASLDRPRAQALLDALVGAWADGMRRAAPFAARTAIAAIANAAHTDDRRAAIAAYEGDLDGSRGERADFALARLFPDFEALARSGEFVRHAERLFGPLLDWTRTSMTIEPHGTRVQPIDATTVDDRGGDGR